MPDKIVGSLAQLSLSITKAQKFLPPSSTPDHPLIAYFPEGQHDIRWLFDPVSEFTRDLIIHQNGNLRTHCPAALAHNDPEGEYPPCAICQYATQTGLWQLKPTTKVLVYGHVYKTTQPSRYWQPGKTYLIVGTQRLGKALDLFLATWLDTELAAIHAMVNPTVAGPATVVHMHKGLNSDVTITGFTPTVFPPIALGTSYKPLAECWLLPGFNLEDYNNVLKALTRTYLGPNDARADGAPPPGP